MAPHLDALLKRRFRAAKCLALLKLTVARIKVARNQKAVTALKLRKEIAQLLRSGQDAHAYRLKTDNLIRLQNIMKAFDLIEQYCNLLTSRLQIMESQRSCPMDVKEAVASLVYAAPRCPDLAELPHVREMFATKYGKQFVTAIGQLRPDCGVNKQIIELLSTRPATGQMRVELMKEIAAENNIDWKGDDEFTMPPADPPGRSDNLEGGSEKARTSQNAHISTPDSGDRIHLASVTTVGSFGAPSRPAGAVIAPDFQAESVYGNVSHLTALDPPPPVSQVETLSASDSTEPEEFKTGVQDVVETSVPDSVDLSDMEFLDAVEEILPDSIETAESEIHFHDDIMAVNDDSIEGSHESTGDNSRKSESDEVDGPNAVVESPPQAEDHGRERIRDKNESVVALTDTSEENRESVSNEVAGPSARVESPLLVKMPTRMHLQKTSGEHDYLGSGKGRQYKDFASAVQVAFESAALAAEAAQAAMGLARSSSNIVHASTGGLEIPNVVSDAGGKLFETNVDPRLVTEEPEVRQEIGRTTNATIDTGLANLDGTLVATCTGSRQAGEPDEGEITSSSEGDVDGLSNLRWNSKRISQEKTSPAEEGIRLGDFKQKSARISEESADPDMINPVSLWNRRIAGARLKHDTDCMYELGPKFDDEEQDSDALVFSEDFRRTPFPGASKETRQTTKPGWGLEAGSTLLTSEEVSHKQSPFTEGVFEDEVAGGKLKSESVRVHEDSTASLKGNGRFSHKLKFDEEVNDGRLALGTTSWDNDREKAEPPASVPLPVNEVVGRSEGKLRWNTSSATVAQDIHEQRKSGGHGESRRTHRGEQKPFAPPPEEQQKEAAAPFVSYRKSEVVGDEHDLGTWEHGESRRTQSGERKPFAPSPEEQQKEAAAASVSYRKSEAVVDEHELRMWGHGESRRTQWGERKPIVPPPEDQQKEGAVASVSYGKSEAVVDEHELTWAHGESRRTQWGERKPSVLPPEDLEKQVAAASVSYGKSEAAVDEHELRMWGHGESGRTQLQPRRPLVSLSEEQDAAASGSGTSRNRKSKVEFQEQKKVGHGANRRTVIEQQRWHLVSFPEEVPAAATVALSRKSEAELDAENEKKGGPPSEEVAFVPSRSEAELDQRGERENNRRSSISKQTVPEVAVAEAEPTAASTTLGKIEANVDVHDVKRQQENWSTPILEQRLHPVSLSEGPAAVASSGTSMKSEFQLQSRLQSKRDRHDENWKTPMAQERWPLEEAASKRKNEAEVVELDTYRHGGSFRTKIAAKDAAVGAVSLTSATSAPSVPSPHRPPPAAPSPPPPTSLTSSSSDPVLLAATPPPDMPPPTASTSSAPAPGLQLPTAASAPPPSSTPTPHSGRTHPKLPDYDALTAQFRKLREEQRAARPS